MLASFALNFFLFVKSNEKLSYEEIIIFYTIFVKITIIGYPYLNYLLPINYSIKIIHGWKNVRDEQIASCRVLLNIHGCKNFENSNIFEHIRCDRLLAAGYKILSESSLFLDEKFINQYNNNLKLVEYSEFLNKELYDNLDWAISTKKTNKQIKQTKTIKEHKKNN
jgi:hypothetical protein